MDGCGLGVFDAVFSFKPANRRKERKERSNQVKSGKKNPSFCLR